MNDSNSLLPSVSLSDEWRTFTGRLSNSQFTCHLSCEICKRQITRIDENKRSWLIENPPSVDKNSLFQTKTCPNRRRINRWVGYHSLFAPLMPEGQGWEAGKRRGIPRNVEFLFLCCLLLSFFICLVFLSLICPREFSWRSPAKEYKFDTCVMEEVSTVLLGCINRSLFIGTDVTGDTTFWWQNLEMRVALSWSRERKK